MPVPSSLPMKKFKCHKVVEAAEIAQVVGTGVSVRTPGGLDLFDCPELFKRSAGPRPGDFLVRYDDGYISFSPREAFLAGYTEQA
jgi:hypothetical protein